MATFDILVLPGDGIGPEVTAEGVRVLELIGERFEHVFKFEQDLVGGASIDANGIAVLPETIEKAAKSDAVLFGAVGGPKWDNPNADVRPEQGLLALRSGLGLWANLRPVTAIPALIDASTLKPEVIEGVDLLVIRELTSGLYFGKPQERRVVNGRREAVDTNYYNEDEIARVAHLGFKTARERRKKLTSIDKANVMASSRLWREVVVEISQEYPDVALEHVLVDAMTMHLIRRPRDFDVMIADNMFGEDGTGLGMYEPIHGSAPDIAGKGIANPLAMILTTAMLLRHSCGLEDEAQAVERAVMDVIEGGLRTADLAAPGQPTLSTREMAEAVLKRLGA
jgi:3-isopropylmalate dehydrogenase